MAPLLLLVNASKVVGLIGAISVAYNALLFRHFAKKNLAPIGNPIDESQEVLASFPIDKDVEEGGFFFALATAPAHVEDKLDDAWLEFAKETMPKDNPAGDPPDVRSGEDPQAVESLGVSLTEEQTATDQKEASEQKAKPVEEGSIAGSGQESEVEDVTPAEGKVEVADLRETRVPLAPTEGNQASDKEIKNGDGLSEWEVLGAGMEKEKVDEETETGLKGKKLERGIEEVEASIKGGEKGFTEEEKLSQISHDMDPEGASDGAVSHPKKIGYERTKLEHPALDFPGTAKKVAKVSMEAMIRGIQKFTEEEEKHNVAAWHNAIHPEERVRFWSDPDTELRLAQGTHSTVFRMGVDWSRIMPIEPLEGLEHSVNWAAVKRYRYIIERVLAHGMRVMLTLFHHSLPAWAAAYGGWKDEKTIKYFLDLTRLAVEHYGDLVDYWITFNEPHVFAMLTYCAGAWPGGDPNLLETVTAAMPQGVYKVVMQAMADAHLGAYDIIHELSKGSRKAKVGVSHHVSFMRPYGLFDVPLVMFSNRMTHFALVDDVAHKLDFLGINYYGQEVVSAPGLKNVENDEYSESGRGVYPDGLYRVLLEFHDRYKRFNLPYIITENGVSDATDYIRRPYIVEHLLAIRAAMDKGVQVQGYCFWTVSDNWEWADGYGPKFGLVAVDRHKNLERHPRPSYYLFAELAKTGKVMKQQRQSVWEDLQTMALQGRTRPFCRAINNHGLMFAGGLDVPINRPFAVRDWRFGHYEVAGLQDPLSSFVRYLREGAMFNRKRRQQKKIANSGTEPVPRSPGQTLLPTGQPQAEEERLERAVYADAHS